jgi:hypothetical protein
VDDVFSMPKWIAHVFDHPVDAGKPEWYFSSDAPIWKDSQEHVATLIADTFERSGELLAPFSDAQLEQGFWYLACESGSGFMRSLVDPSVPVETRLRGLRSFVPLFQQIMAQRCSSHLSHLNEPGANALNTACYMWWDILPIHGEPENPDRAEFDAEVLQVLSRLLSIPHDACRESALHGISEWQLYYPSIRGVIENWLAQTPGLRPELISYANRAKVGNVL